MQTAKTFVPILVFEDAPLRDSFGLRKAVGLPRLASVGGQDYEFNWHPVYNALGGIQEAPSPDPVLIRSITEYRNAITFLGTELAGQAILFFDLHFSNDAGSTLFPLDDTDVTEDMLKFTQCYKGEMVDGRGARAYLNPERLGLALASVAAANPNWQGVITFASKRTDINLDKLQDCLRTGDRILWRNMRMALVPADAVTPVDRARFIHAAIDAFLEQQKGPPFWPTYTEGWFKDNENDPTHVVPSPDKNYNAVKLVRKYLDQLLPGFIPPKSWFLTPQWTILYETLKHLIGACSVSGRTPPGEKNLRLATVPLLLAAQMAWKKGDIDWLKSFEWNSDGLVEIMAHDSKVEAQEAIRAMAVFLEHLSVGKNGSQVIGATWGKVADDKATHLWIDFRIDPLSRATGRSLLQTIFGLPWGNSVGQTVGAYEKMMKRAAKAGPSSAPKFSLCIYPKADSEGQLFTRLDFRALGV
jgi:hypothetical protein